jgi:hypothetical protein
MLITQLVFFRKIHVTLHLCRESLFGAITACLHLEIPKFQKVFLSKAKYSHEETICKEVQFLT